MSDAADGADTRTSEDQDLLLQLPFEALIEILSYLSVGELVATAATCSALRDAVSSDYIWRNLCVRCVPGPLLYGPLLRPPSRAARRLLCPLAPPADEPRAYSPRAAASTASAFSAKCRPATPTLKTTGVRQILAWPTVTRSCNSVLSNR